MADSPADVPVLLPACRELLDTHPGSHRIREQVEGLEEAMPNRPGVVVSLCQSLIETACKTILADRNVPANPKRLVSQVVRELGLGVDEDGAVDRSVREGAKKLLSGLHSIVQGVSEIRNVHGLAAHGADAYAPLLDVHYIEILVRSTDAVVGLLFKTHRGAAQKDPLARIRYGDHSDFDQLIDDQYGPFEVLETSLLASAALFHTEFETYRAQLVQFKLEQQDSVEAEEEQE